MQISTGQSIPKLSQRNSHWLDFMIVRTWLPRFSAFALNSSSTMCLWWLRKPSLGCLICTQRSKEGRSCSLCNDHIIAAASCILFCVSVVHLDVAYTNAVCFSVEACLGNAFKAIVSLYLVCLFVKFVYIRMLVLCLV